MTTYDLTEHEENELLRKGKQIGIKNKIDLLRVAEYKDIMTGTALINYIDACCVLGRSLENLLRRRP